MLNHVHFNFHMLISYMSYDNFKKFHVKFKGQGSLRTQREASLCIYIYIHGMLSLFVCLYAASPTHQYM